MKFIVLVLVLAAIWVSSLVLTAAVRRYAMRALMDVPNARSSHSTATPRGGGLAIAAAFLLAVAGLAAVDMLAGPLAAAFIGGGTLVMLIGWIDDHRHVPARWRLAVHIAAGAWAVYWLGGYSKAALGSYTLQLGWAGEVLALLGIVWLINLYNFMDGIDGLAAGEAVTVALVAAGLLWWAGAPGLALVAMVLAAACGGFLWWNWSPAKIFMGDVGSGFLGYCFAVLMLASEKAGAVPVTVWVILLAVFVLDATYTLIGRVIRGESWYTAHRTHAYQRLTQSGFSHAKVTAGVMLVNLLLLAPLAWLVVLQPTWIFLALPGVAVVGWLAWRTIQHRFGKTPVEK